ncbi:hypothetical protein MRY82_02925 [bacterium]|nr:hypothetical protein [bacterium]
MMMETLKKTATIVILLITCQVMAQTVNAPIYGVDIPYPSHSPLTEDQVIVQAIGPVDNYLIAHFNRPIVDRDSDCTIKAQKNGKPYYSLVFSNCEKLYGELTSIPVSGWRKLAVARENQREFVTKNQYSKRVYSHLNSCGSYDQCSQTVEYTLLFSDNSILNNASGEVQNLNNYQLNVMVIITQNYWDMITDEPIIGRLPKKQYGPASVETINLVLNY